MNTIAISVFKAQALQIIEDVSKTGTGLVITKRGKPLAQIMPYLGPGNRPTPGRLAEAFVSEKDIVSPLGPGEWEACR